MPSVDYLFWDRRSELCGLPATESIMLTQLALLFTISHRKTLLLVASFKEANVLQANADRSLMLY